jgi:hypothetical protein
MLHALRLKARLDHLSPADSEELDKHLVVMVSRAVPSPILSAQSALATLNPKSESFTSGRTASVLMMETSADSMILPTRLTLH